jgi:hypothetical protein
MKKKTLPSRLRLRKETIRVLTDPRTLRKFVGGENKSGVGSQPDPRLQPPQLFSYPPYSLSISDPTISTETETMGSDTLTSKRCSFSFSD